MTATDLQKRIEASPPLSRLRDQLGAELAAQWGDRAAFDPFLVIAIISILVQVIIHCRNQRSASELAEALPKLASLPPRQRMRLTRRLNQLWREECQRRGDSVTKPNPLLAAVTHAASSLDAESAQELIALAE
jgi:hypothetical protein